MSKTITNHFPYSVMLVMVIFTIIGCGGDMHPAPLNASAAEMPIVDRLKPFAENVSWNASGHVQTLDLSNRHISDADVTEVSKLTYLEELALSGTQISDAGAARLVELQNLRALSLAWTKISDETLKSLVNMENLVLLDLRNTQISDEGIRYLSQIDSLKTLFLEGVSVSAESLKQLQGALPQCRIQ